MSMSNLDVGINIFEFNFYEYQFNQVIDKCFNTLLFHCILHMYEDHTIKCSSCGKSFISKEHETVCQECSKELENIK
jgi:Zn finger protein HypA/HybF involved in hydrogenase expression